MCCRRLLFSAAASSTQSAPSRSAMLAGRTMTTTRFPWVSTRMCRLRPMILFPPVEAPFSPGFGGRDRLAVDDPGTRLGLSPNLLTGLLSERTIDPDEGAIEGPVIEVVRDGIPVGEVGGQESLLAAGAREIEKRVDHLPQVHRGRAAHVSLSRDQRSDQFPLCVGQIGGIAVCGRCRHGDRRLSRMRGSSLLPRSDKRPKRPLRLKYLHKSKEES